MRIVRFPLDYPDSERRDFFLRSFDDFCLLNPAARYSVSITANYILEGTSPTDDSVKTYSMFYGTVFNSEENADLYRLYYIDNLRSTADASRNVPFRFDLHHLLSAVENVRSKASGTKIHSVTNIVYQITGLVR